MNTRAVLVLIALLGWGWFTWSWLNDKKQECCLLTTVAQKASAPLSNTTINNQSINGEGLAAYIKDIPSSMETNSIIIHNKNAHRLNHKVAINIQ